MTVEEVKTILQTAGINLNDTQYAAIQSLLGGGDIHYTEINENNLAEIVNKAMYFQIFIKVDPHVEESKGDTKGDTKAMAQPFDAIWYYIYVVLSNGDKLACNKEYIPAFFDKNLPIVASSKFRDREVVGDTEAKAGNLNLNIAYFGVAINEYIPLQLAFDEDGNLFSIGFYGNIPGQIQNSIPYISDNIYKYTPEQ